MVNEDTPYYLGVLIANEQHDTIRSVLMALGVLNELNRFMSRYMNTTKVRMRSFRNCMIQLKKKPELYCEAGFIYSGKCDIFIFIFKLLYNYISYTNFLLV